MYGTMYILPILLSNFRGKVAVSEIRKKIYDSNPHVAKNALIVSSTFNTKQNEDHLKYMHSHEYVIKVLYSDCFL